MLRAAVFDVDGTLVDTVDLHARAWQDAFRKWGKDVDFVEVRSQIGKGGDQILPMFFSPEEIRSFGKEMSEWRGEHFKSVYLPQAKSFPKTRELFSALRDSGVKLALACGLPTSIRVTARPVAWSSTSTKVSSACVTSP